jgi:DNA-binding transcriptional MerR regulator
MSTTAQSTRRERLLTIGAVCQRLKGDFPEISISKIRYLEDQGLLAPRRTSGGYRLFSEDDVERLHRILELQRDEFLPLRVIRQELAAPSRQERKRRRGGLTEAEPEIGLDEVVDRAGAPRDLVRELEEFGILEPRSEGGTKWYSETDVEIAAACARLARFGISARHLRTFRTAADRESALLEALVAPSLRSRNAERRQQAVRELEALGDAAHELSRLLFWRDLRAFVAR